VATDLCGGRDLRYQLTLRGKHFRYKRTPNCTSLGKEPGLTVSNPVKGFAGEGGNRFASRLERSACFFAHPCPGAHFAFWGESDLRLLQDIRTAPRGAWPSAITHVACHKAEELQKASGRQPRLTYQRATSLRGISAAAFCALYHGRLLLCERYGHPRSQREHTRYAEQGYRHSPGADGRS
jgi:hypothetical protein